MFKGRRSPLFDAGVNSGQKLDSAADAANRVPSAAELAGRFGAGLYRDPIDAEDEAELRWPLLQAMNYELGRTGYLPITEDELIDLQKKYKCEHHAIAAQAKWDTLMPRVAEWGVAQQKEKYTYTFTSFSGADAMYIINGEIVGEIERIDWTESYVRPIHSQSDKPLVGGIIMVTVFDHETGMQRALKNGKPLSIATYFANEYGQRCVEVYEKPFITQRQGGVSVDHIVRHDIYSFGASEVLRFRIPSDIPYLLDDGTVNPDIYDIARLREVNKQ